MLKKSGSTLLQLSGLQTAFIRNGVTTFTVDDINFSINHGETFVLLGESGSGKSVIAMSIMRLLPANARVQQGSIFFDGQDLLTLPEYAMRNIRGRRIAMIFQEPQTSLNPVLSVGRQIGETLARHQGLYGAEQYRRSIDLLEAVYISDPERRINEYPHQFSGGMKQRIMIAMALAGSPDLLIADEPTTALDVTIQAQILELLRQLQKDMGMGILFITHDLAVAYEMADYITVMRNGRIVEQNTRDDFYSNPQHEYSKELFRMQPNRIKRDSEAETSQSAIAKDQPLLTVRDLKIHFPIKKGVFKKTVGYVKAVDGVSIDINCGQTLAMVGESGSGKTTFGKGILQLLQITSGSVMFNGQELTRIKGNLLRQKRLGMQIVFQDPYSSMNPRMMISDIIQEGMIAQGIGGTAQQRIKRTEELLEQVGIQPMHKDCYPHEFSGGQRQRICIARALAVEPKLLICDEPTSALDVLVQAQILAMLGELQKDMGLSYLLITHNISVVEYIAHRVAVMYQGNIVEQGTTDQVLNDSKHPYTRQLLGSVPKIGYLPDL